MDENKKPAFQWHANTGMRIVLEISAIIAPLLLFLGALAIGFYIFRDQGQESGLKHQPAWQDLIVAKRVFAGSDLSSNNFYSVLSKNVSWENLKIYYPFDWIHFVENRFGGKTLTIQPDVESSYGIQFQVSKLTDETECTRTILTFLKQIGLTPDKLNETTVAKTKAYQCTTRYTTGGYVPMTGRFFFIPRKSFLFRIVIFGQEETFTHRSVLLNAILDSVSFSDSAAK